MKLNYSFLMIVTFLLSISMQSQTYKWYENSTSTNHTPYESTSSSTFEPDVTTPSTTGNTNATVSKVTTTGTSTSFTNFALPNKITDLTDLTISLKMYLDVATENIDITNRRVRVFLQNSTTNTVGQIYEEFTITTGQEWLQHDFDFNGTVIDAAVLAEGGFDRVRIAFVRTGSSALNIVSYFDTLEGTIDQEVYLTPEIAVLDLGNEWYHNYSTNEFKATTTSVSVGTFLEQGNAVATPSTKGNSSPLVAQFTKAEGVHSNIQFEAPLTITTSNVDKAIYKVRVYVPANATTTNSNIKLGIRNGASATGQKILTSTTTIFDKWQELTFDFSGLTLDPGTSYTHLWMFFDQPDTDGDATGNVYYIDAFQGPEGVALSLDNITDKDTSNLLKVFPNPVVNSFTVSTKVVAANIYTTLGQVVKSYNAEQEFNVSDLASGIYIFRATLENGTTSHVRFVKK